jgi:hypothetical protein
MSRCHIVKWRGPAVCPPSPLEQDQPACKPGSVWRESKLSHVTAIHLGRRLPVASSNLPGRPDPDTGPAHHCLRSDARAVPIRFCSRWGLPCRFRCRKRGALLPHRFTLTSSLAGRGGLFSVALSLRSPSPDVIRHRMSMEPGLSSQGHLSALPQAAVRPTDDLEVGAFRALIKQSRTMLLTVRAVSRWWSGPRRHRPGPGGNGAGRP